MGSEVGNGVPQIYGRIMSHTSVRPMPYSVTPGIEQLFDQSESSGSEDFNDDLDDPQSSGAESDSESNHESIISMSLIQARETGNLGIVALLIPITGVATMVLTEVVACTHHFDCTTEYPTLSYAAVFKPEGHVFTIGMCLTSIFCFSTFILFHWFMRLRLLTLMSDRTTVLVLHTSLIAGIVASTALFGLAVFDMGSYHDIHVNLTGVFFVCAWIGIIMTLIARWRLMREDEASKITSSRALASAIVCRQLASLPGVWEAITRWRRMSLLDAYQLGRFFTYMGLTSSLLCMCSTSLYITITELCVGSVLVAISYNCANGFWPNPIGFTSVQEACFEAFSIVCQLFYMGTLSCELSMLKRVVERHDYMELQRAE